MNNQAISRKGAGQASSGNEQGGKGLGQPLERSLRPGRRLFDVDPVGCHAHQEVGTGPRTEFTVP